MIRIDDLLTRHPAQELWLLRRDEPSRAYTLSPTRVKIRFSPDARRWRIYWRDIEWMTYEARDARDDGSFSLKEDRAWMFETRDDAQQWLFEHNATAKTGAQNIDASTSHEQRDLWQTALQSLFSLKRGKLRISDGAPQWLQGRIPAVGDRIRLWHIARDGRLSAAFDGAEVWTRWYSDTEISVRDDAGEQHRFTHTRDDSTLRLVAQFVPVEDLSTP